MQAALYERFAPKMYGVCLRYTSDQEEAQDILQEGFIKVFRNLEKFRQEGSFEGWIRRIVINTAIEHFRRRKHLQPVTEKEEAAIEATEESALDRLAEKDIIALVRQLSPGYRAVFNLYVIEGYGHKEIAEMLGISEGTSKSQLARAKAVLQRLVQTYLSERRTTLKSGS
ncbi:RNA polymerase sigma factor [Parasegetibacter sp. NRK P23]|uniref:RNA polymerase sigma factor n=1 Tax=Parasegetibacter sp. NRK P23 TaxID=2942999 RepID=UPI0021125A05|nr:RNA polymerase sigma factor [Parasegetibacter sp. NRK P23]